MHLASWGYSLISIVFTIVYSFNSVVAIIVLKAKTCLLAFWYTLSIVIQKFIVCKNLKELQFWKLNWESCRIVIKLQIYTYEDKIQRESFRSYILCNTCVFLNACRSKPRTRLAIKMSEFCTSNIRGWMF